MDRSQFFDLPRTATYGLLSRIGEGALFCEENKGDGSDGTTPPKADPAAQLVAVSAELAALKKADADRAQAANDTTKKAGEDKLIAEGKLKQLLEQKESDLAALKSDADYGKAARAADEMRLSEAKAKLPAADQALVDAVPPAAREALIARLSAAAGAGAPTAKPSAGSGPPPVGGAIDFAEAWKDPAKWAEAKAKNAQGADAWFSKQALGSSQPVSFLRQRPKSA